MTSPWAVDIFSVLSSAFQQTSVLERAGIRAFHFTLRSLLPLPPPAKPPPKKTVADAFPHCYGNFLVAWTKIYCQQPSKEQLFAFLSLHCLLNVKSLSWESILHLATFVLRIIFLRRIISSATHPPFPVFLGQRQIWKEWQMISKYYIVQVN